MPDTKMGVVNSAYKLSITPSTSAQTKILTTENKFVDKNIVIEVPSVTAATGPKLAINDSTATVTVGTVSSGRFPLTNSLSGITSYTTAGWIGTSGLGAATDTSVTVGYIAQSTLANGNVAIASGDSITPSTTATQTINISAGYEAARTIEIAPMSSGTQAAATITALRQAPAPTIADVTTDLTGKTRISVTPSTSSTLASDKKYYISLKTAIADTTYTAAQISKTVNTVGYLGAASQITASALFTGNNQNYYIPLTTAAITITANGTAASPTAASNTASTVTGKTNLKLSAVSATSSINTPYFVALNLNSAATNLSSFTKEVTTNGYITNADANSAISITGSVGAGTSTYYIPVTQGVLSAKTGSVTATSVNNVVFTTASSAPAAGTYAIKVEGSGTVGVGTDGWLDTSKNQTSNVATSYLTLNSATMTQNQSAGTVSVSEGYVPSAGLSVNVTRGSISTGATDKSSSGYASNTTAIVPSQGYLYINAGYLPNTQISLDTLLGGDTDTAATTVNHILAGYAAYDVDGKLLTGAIPTYDGSYTES